MLIYFSPAFYCDVSDAWMFPNAAAHVGDVCRRIFAADVWGCLHDDLADYRNRHVINHIMVVVVLFSGLQTLLNFNPLIKLDGYYMLSDYLEIPNLRSQGFQRLFGTGSREASRAQALPRGTFAADLWRVCGGFLVNSLSGCLFTRYILGPLEIGRPQDWSVSPCFRRSLCEGRPWNRCLD